VQEPRSKPQAPCPACWPTTRPARCSTANSCAAASKNTCARWASTCACPRSRTCAAARRAPTRCCRPRCRSLRERKLGHLGQLAPQVIISANIGCITHLQSGTDARAPLDSGAGRCACMSRAADF
jgi:hypothetical protein